MNTFDRAAWEYLYRCKTPFVPVAKTIDDHIVHIKPRYWMHRRINAIGYACGVVHRVDNYGTYVARCLNTSDYLYGIVGKVSVPRR